MTTTLAARQVTNVPDASQASVARADDRIHLRFTATA